MHRNMNGEARLPFCTALLLMSERKKIDRFAAVPVRVGERLAVITFPGFDADTRRLPVCGVE